MKLLATLVSAALLVSGCAGLYSSVITITKVRKDTLNELGKAYRVGLISPEQDRKIATADREYLKAAASAQRVLEAYKAGSATQAEVDAQIAIVKVTLTELLNIAEPFVVKTPVLKSQLATATQL